MLLSIFFSVGYRTFMGMTKLHKHIQGNSNAQGQGQAEIGR